MPDVAAGSSLLDQLERAQARSNALESRLRELERAAFLSTERLQAALDAQQEVGEHLEEICRVMPGALLVVDAAGCVCDGNDETTSLLGYSRAELTALNARSLFEPQAALERAAIDQLLALTTVYRCEKTCKTRSGELVPVLFSAASLGRDSEAPGFICVLTDLRERKRLEVELAQAQKLESVGRLAAGVAHEINTPVQFVSDSVHFVRDGMRDLHGLIERYRGFARAAHEGSASAADAAQLIEAERETDLEYLFEHMPLALERALFGLERVATIVRSLKQIADADSVDMSEVDLNKLLESTLVIASNEYKYVADVKTDWGELPVVLCHAGEMSQVFLNIIINAAQAIGEAVAGTSERGLISLRTWCADELVVVSISDTGGGVPEAHRAKLFEQFFTTKAVGVGTGQGLAVGRSVITKHGGTIDFETESGRGTTFFVRLPVRAC